MNIQKIIAITIIISVCIGIVSPLVLADEIAVADRCEKCGGTKKCQVCWGTGKNLSGDDCSICNGTGKCYYCGGTGKK